MYNNTISVNNKCEIIWDKDIYKSNVQDITEEYIAISLPIANGSYANLVKNDKIEVIYNNEDNLYSFEAKVIGRKKEKNIPMILINIPEEDQIKKIQRRRNFRIDLFEKVFYKVFDKENFKESMLKSISGEVEEFLQGTMVDLSGGGMKLLVQGRIELGSLVIVQFGIHNKQIIAKGVCVRCIKLENGEFSCGIEFHEIDGRQRENIISYTFDIMRERMKKR